MRCRLGNGKSYANKCFCGAVQLTAGGEPAGMDHRHLESCRHWSAWHFNAFTLWKLEAVQIAQGTDLIGTSNKSPHGYRKGCTTC